MKSIHGFYPLWFSILLSIFGSELTEFSVDFKLRVIVDNRKLG